MEDQTDNRIREEKLNTLKSMLWELGHTNKDAHHVIEYVDELLKSQEHKLIEEWYTKGFKDGFSYSAEGFNGEYTHPDVNPENDLYEQIGSNLSNLIKNN